MADSFFGFDTALPSHDRDESPFDEDEYDALNDETFGADDVGEDDWEQRHEQLAEITESARVHRNSLNEADHVMEENDIEASLGRLVLDEPESPKKRRPPATSTPVRAGGGGWPNPPSLPLQNGNITNILNQMVLQHQAATRMRNVEAPRVPSVRTVEELEREMMRTRRSPQKVEMRPPSNPLAELIRFQQQPPAHLQITGVPPRFLPPNKHQHPNFSHPPPILALPPGFPHRIPPPPTLMNRPPPNFRLPLPFPWMHQPPPLVPPPSVPRQNGVGDPYAGLMSGKDKQWLINIQILQLNSQKPYVDDFYFTAYQLKLRAARERAGERVDVPKREQRTLEPRAYTPAQFEGSLGKLQVVSVTAPRKIIDMEVVGTESGDQSQPTRDSRRTKQILLELERLYLVVLRLEDLFHSLPEARLSVSESKEELTAKAVSILTAPPGTDEKIPAMLCVRKGKTLLSRLLPHLSPSQQLPLWLSLLKCLWVITRRDVHDCLLLDLLPSLSPLLEQLSSPQVLAVVQALSGDTPPPAKTPLLVALSSKFGVSVVSCVVNRAAQLPDVLTLPEWQSFVSCLADASESNAGSSLPSPLVSLSDAGVSQLSAQPRLAALALALA